MVTVYHKTPLRTTNRAKLISVKGHCHAIWQLYKKLEDVFASIELHHLKVLKLFPVACHYGWHLWKWIEI